ncbi:MAG TPA: chemotaxis protein CheD [Holophaga sp.]|nr:chemotaxis protein CheD [Holophaga sp.]
MLPDFEPREVFLHPGDYAFGDERTRIHTLLGSCVAVTFWHPELRIGAMCHYLLPSRPAVRDRVEGCYAQEVIPAISDWFLSRGLQPAEFHVKMFGGSNMSPGLSLDDILSIGSKNIYVGERLLGACGFRIAKADLAGVSQRRVIFELWSGDVWVRQGTRLQDGEEAPEPEPFRPRRRPS